MNEQVLGQLMAEAQPMVESIGVQEILVLIFFMVLHYIILYLEYFEVYMFRDQVVGNIVFSKYILYNLQKVTGLKMSGAFIVGTLFSFNMIVNKISLGQWLS